MTEATPLASEQITDPKADARKKMYAILRDWNVGDFASRVCSVKGHGSLASDICEAELDAFGEELLAALSASPAPSGQGVSGEAARLVADLNGIRGAFERIAEKHPNDQPAYKDGVRPWGTGDLRHVIETLTAAATRLAAPAPSCAPGEVERLRAALSAAASDCQLAHDALGNSPPAFDSVRRGFGIIRERILAALSPQGLDAKEGDEFAGMTAGEAISASADNDTLMRDLSFAYVSASKRMPGVAAVIDRARNALSATPSQRLDAATVEQAAISLIVDLCGAGASQSSTNVRVVEDHLRQFARTLATDPHQHGGKGA